LSRPGNHGGAIPDQHTCRHLGTPGDPKTCFGYPHPQNHCYAVEPAYPVRTEHQGRYCLSSAHRRCRIYRYFQWQSPQYNLEEAHLQTILELPWQPAPWLRSALAILGMVVLAALAILAVYRSPFFTPSLGRGSNSPAALQASSIPSTLSVTPSEIPTSPPPPAPTSEGDLETLIRTVTSPEQVFPGVIQTSTNPVEAMPSSPEPTRTQAPSPTSSICTHPGGWVVYTVQPGDTLFGLAQMTATTVDEIRRANCLSGNLIDVGQQLYLPWQPIRPGRPTDTPPPKPTAVPTQSPPTVTQPPPPTATQPPPPTATQPPPSTSTPRLTPTTAPTIAP
jgi:LysM repeat protein